MFIPENANKYIYSQFYIEKQTILAYFTTRDFLPATRYPRPATRDPRPATQCSSVETMHSTTA